MRTKRISLAVLAAVLVVSILVNAYASPTSSTKGPRSEDVAILFYANASDAYEALEVGVEYAGVVVFGAANIVNDPEEATHGLRLLLDKYFPQLEYGVDYKPILPEALKTTAVIRIDIESWSGKEALEKDEYPGAFFYEDLASDA